MENDPTLDTTGQSPVNNADTTEQQVESTTPSDTSRTTVEHEDSSNSAPTQDSGNAEGKRDLSREDGKISKLETENQKINRTLNEIVSDIAEDPELMARYYMRKGLSSDEAIRRTQQAHPTWNTGGNQSNQQAPQQGQQAQAPYQTPMTSPFREQALQKLEMQEREKMESTRNAILDFEGKYPNIEYSTKRAIASTAAMYTEKGMGIQQALEKARLQILEPDKLVKQGEVEGMSKAYSSQGYSGSGASGGSAARNDYALSAVDEQVMKSLGLKTKEQRDEFIRHSRSDS